MQYRSILLVCALCVAGCPEADAGGSAAWVAQPAGAPAPAPMEAAATPATGATTPAAAAPACTPVACTPQPAQACTPVACTPAPADQDACPATPAPEPAAPVTPATPAPLTVYSVLDSFCQVSGTHTQYDGRVFGCWDKTVDVSYEAGGKRIKCVTATDWGCTDDGAPEGCVRYERRLVAEVECVTGAACTVSVSGQFLSGTCTHQTASVVGL